MKHTSLLPIALLVCILSCCGTTFADESTKPNIILLFLDDQAHFGLAAAGNDQIKTPQMDRLAADGVLFQRHYNSTAICMASRASVMTGMYEYKTGCNFMHGPMRPKTWEKSFPMLLRKSGYRTGFAGKFGFAISDGQSENDNSWDVLPVDDFDSWAGGLGQTNYATAKNKYLKQYADRYPHSSRAYGAFAQDFIAESTKSAEPFCLSLFFKAPHYPQTPDPFFDDIYEGTVFKKPANHGRDAAKHLAPQSRMGRQYNQLYERFGFDDDGYQTAIRNYYQQIYGVDYALGMLREELEKQKLAENTIIILTSDNGYFCGAHGFGGKVLPYEEGSRVPLVIFDPTSSTMIPGSRFGGLTATVDIAPTILDYAGHDVPKNMDGYSLRERVNGSEDRVRQSLPLFQLWGEPATYSMSIVSESHKYIYWPYAEGMVPSDEFFDLENDPLEMANRFSSDSEDEQLILTVLREKYRLELSKFRNEAVSYNHYKEFGTILDPDIPWSEKKPLIRKERKRKK